MSCINCEMHAYTDHLLSQWALWQRESAVGSIKPNILAVRTPSAISFQMDDDTAMRVDLCLAKLKLRDLQLYKLLLMRYVHCMSINQIALAQHDNRIAIDRRLAAAIAWIDCALQMM